MKLGGWMDSANRYDVDTRPLPMVWIIDKIFDFYHACKFHTSYGIDHSAEVYAATMKAIVMLMGLVPTIFADNCPENSTPSLVLKFKAGRRLEEVTDNYAVLAVSNKETLTDQVTLCFRLWLRYDNYTPLFTFWQKQINVLLRGNKHQFGVFFINDKGSRSVPID